MFDCFTYIEKSDSTNDRSEGYLYYTYSQSSSLSIYILLVYREFLKDVKLKMGLSADS